MIKEARKVVDAMRSVDPRMEAQTFDHLVTIAEQEGITVMRLADSVDNADGTASRNVAKLVEMGLVRKDFDKKDGRIRRCYLTDAGREVFQCL